MIADHDSCASSNPVLAVVCGSSNLVGQVAGSSSSSKNIALLGKNSFGTTSTSTNTIAVVVVAGWCSTSSSISTSSNSFLGFFCRCW